jgi:xanthine dehydrogenase accessory factor
MSEAMITVLATEGSAPRGAGARMVVSAGALRGTIGGGRLEYQAVERARALLAQAPGAWEIRDYALGPMLGQCCGGRVRLLIEHCVAGAWEGGECVATLREGFVERRAAGMAAPLPARGDLPGLGASFLEPGDGPRLPLMLFGAGHVGRALAARLPGLPITLGWYDARADHDGQGVVIAPERDLIAAAGAASPEAAVVIMTHDHALDYRLCAAALRGRAGFVGLIGSATKRARFMMRLAGEGVDAARLTCPIGLPGIVGKEPDVIAMAVLAQVLMLPRVAQASMEQAA